MQVPAPSAGCVRRRLPVILGRQSPPDPLDRRLAPPPGAASCPAAGQRGSVTAEIAAVLPSVLLVLALVVWLAAAATAQLQCVDAARVGARAVARGEDPALIRANALRASPPGAVVDIGAAGDLVSVSVRAQVRPFGSLLAAAPALHVQSRSVAVAEAASSPGAGGIEP